MQQTITPGDLMMGDFNMLKLTSATSIVVLLSAVTANAADVGDRKGSLKDEPVYNITTWNGLYAGATLGYASGSSEHFLDRGGDHGTASSDPDGFLVGLTAGYNYQFAPRWVAGVEGDVNFGDISGDENKRIFDGHHWHGGWGPLATLRGRVGYTYGKALIYGTAGIAFMDSDEWVQGNTAPESAYNDGWHTGWVLGAGVEYAFNERWSGKVEYLHIGLGETDGYDGNREAYTFDNDLDIIRVGLNYKINY